MDVIYQSLWYEWALEIDKLSTDYPSFVTVFSSGNDGPSFSGFPQSLMTNAVIVGASDKYGNIADFSSQDYRMYCVAGGDRTYVANPTEAGQYMIVSGTSFSCPTVAAMIVKLLAENPSWEGNDALNYLDSQMVQSSNSDLFNTVWGYGELEQFNQTVPRNIWRLLGYPTGAKSRSLEEQTPNILTELPRPITSW